MPPDDQWRGERLRVFADRASIVSGSLLQYVSNQWTPVALSAFELVPPGAIFAWGGAAAPTGFAFLYGQNVSRASNPVLFTNYGTTYGVGDGSTTFGLPDLRGRVIAGQDDMGGVSANRLTGLAGGVDGDVLGGTGGAESHTLAIGEITAHTHDVNPASVTSTGHSGTHTHAVSITSGDQSATHNHDFSGDTASNTTSTGGGSRVTQLVSNNGGTQDRTTTSASVGHTHLVSGNTGNASADHTHNVDVANTTSTSAGGGGAHNNVQPTIILNYIIRLG